MTELEVLDYPHSNMKTFIHAFFTLLLTVTLAKADWVLIQKTNADGQEKEMTTKIKGDLARVDIGPEMSAILGTEGMTMLMHTQKMIMKMDVATLKSAMEMAAKMAGPQGDKPLAKPVSTGKKEKVGDWEAEVFTWEGQMGKGSFWVVKDFPKFAEINAVSDKLGKAMGNPMAKMAPQASDFGGMVVKSEMTMMGKNITTVLVSAKEQALDAKEFAAPEGYNEMKMPAMPGAPAK